MKRDNDKIARLRGFQTPETPRAKKKDSDFTSLKEAVDKAKKYDELIKQIKQDKTTFAEQLDAYKKQRSFLRIGYTNGYVDGKIVLYNEFIGKLSSYLED